MSLGGTFTLEKNENIEAFLKALAVPDEMITKFSSRTGGQTLTISLEGKTLKMASTHGDKHLENVLTIGTSSTFKLANGVEFQVEMQMPAGNVAKGTFNVKGKQGEVTIEFGGGQLTETFTFAGVSAKRTYKK